MTCTHKQFINKILQHTTSYNALCTLISGCIASLLCGQLGWKSVLSDIIIIIFYTSVVKIPRVKRKKRKLKKVVWKGGQRSGSLLQENVSCKSTALKHWIVMEMCWYKYSLSRTSFVLALIIWPNLSKKCVAESLMGPSVSTAMGWNWKEAGRSAYFTDFLYAACSAAATEEVEDAPT